MALSILLNSQSLQLVSAGIKNQDFIFNTFKEALKEYVEWAWGWDDAQQRRSLFAAAPIQEFRIICLDDEPVGALLLQRRANDHYLRTIFLQPNHRRHGIGQWVIDKLQQQAASEVKPLQLRVIRTNPAQRLYERMGFATLQAEEKTLLMQWEAPKGSESV